MPRRLPDDLLERAFLKPADSHAFQIRFGRKAFRFTGVDEAERLAAEARAAGLEVMAQEYLPGPPTAHWFVDGFVDREGRMCGSSRGSGCGCGRRTSATAPPW